MEGPRESPWYAGDPNARVLFLKGVVDVTTEVFGIPVTLVDLGVRALEIGGQEIPTRDKVALRINLTALRLKELETLEKVTEKVGNTSICSGLHGVMEQMVRIKR